jgi:hypothetical protein
MGHLALKRTIRHAEANDLVSRNVATLADTPQGPGRPAIEVADMPRAVSRRRDQVQRIHGSKVRGGFPRVSSLIPAASMFLAPLIK